MDTGSEFLEEGDSKARNVVSQNNLNELIGKPMWPISSTLKHDSDPESSRTVVKTPVPANTEEKMKPDQFQLSSRRAGQCISYLSSIFTPTYNYLPISLISLIKKHKNSKQSVKIRLILDSGSK